MVNGTDSPNDESLEARKQDLLGQVKRLEDRCTPTPFDKNFITRTHSRKILATIHKESKADQDLLDEFDPQYKRTVIRRLKVLENGMKCVTKQGNKYGKYHLTDTGERLLQWARESLRSNIKPEHRTAALKEKQAVVVRILRALPKIQSCIDSCDGGPAAPYVIEFLEELIGLLQRTYSLQQLNSAVHWALGDLQPRVKVLDPADQESFQEVVDNFTEYLSCE